MSWVPLRVRSTYSILTSPSKPEDIAARMKELGYASCAITDSMSLSGVPEVLHHLKENGIKGIAGCELNICHEHSSVKTPENRSTTSICVLAKNHQGWLDLVAAVNYASSRDALYYVPRLSLKELSEFAKGNWVIISGKIGSHFANVCFSDHREILMATEDGARRLIDPDWKDNIAKLAEEFRQLFPQEDLFLEIQLTNQDVIPANIHLSKILRWASAHHKIPKVATTDSFYCRPVDAIDQRVLLATKLKTTVRAMMIKIESGEIPPYFHFFKSDSFCIPSSETLIELHLADELENSLKIAEMCEPPVLENAPNLPKYDSGEMSNDEMMKEICRKGWAKKILPKVPKDKIPEYVERVKYELDTLIGAGLSGYFLITQDYIRYAVEKCGMSAPIGRGSAAGCLVSYLMGITGVDPIPFGLLFERFYNAGRNTPGKVSLPDIDTDFSQLVRPKVLQYVRDKYGENHVAQLATFIRFKGRSALQAVLRANGWGTHEEIIRLTKPIPDEAEISDELEEMEDSSIIRWALENRANRLKDWCRIGPDGELTGELADAFSQAIRLEGMIKAQSRHASAVIITGFDLTKTVPQFYDTKSRQNVIALDMHAAERYGLVKFDLLCTIVIDKLDRFREICKYGREGLRKGKSMDDQFMAIEEDGADE